MSYEIPYTFVPGTKARADEVNANFIEVMQKISNTNDRIDETNSDISDVSSAVDTINSDLGDINSSISTLQSSLSTANTNISQKANSSDIDGQWVTKYATIIDNVSIAEGGGSLTYSLSSALPNDSNVYEVMLTYSGSIANQNGYAQVQLSNSYITGIFAARVGAGNIYAVSTVIMPFGSNRNITLTSNTSQKTALKNYLGVRAYRKVR